MDTLKFKFLNYVETQRNANDIRMNRGSEHKLTIEAYESANKLKREVLDMIELIKE
jgi:hypothetical protein|tara:strand:+ start:16746 stop:16913 length:168 start_codon:yes stop_codon:yes gene_type:complete